MEVVYETRLMNASFVALEHVCQIMPKNCHFPFSSRLPCLPRFRLKFAIVSILSPVEKEFPIRG